MSISNPEPGELVKTVAELVTAVNAQSGASVAPTDRLYIASDSATTSLASGASYTAAVLDGLDDPPGIVGTALSHDGTGIVVEEDGTFSFWGGAFFPDNTDSTRRGIRFIVGNGGDEPAEIPRLTVPAISGTQMELTIAMTAVTLAAGTTVQIAASQSSGSSMDLSYAFLYGRRIG